MTTAIYWLNIQGDPIPNLNLSVTEEQAFVLNTCPGLSHRQTMTLISIALTCPTQIQELFFFSS